jgi:hypothetical protein
MKPLELAPCQVPNLNLSCYGCCGRNFKTQEKIEKDIKDNTIDFKEIKIPSTLRLLQFRDRLSENPDDLKKSGICSNLVDFGNNIYACPLHKNIQQLIPQEQKLFIHKKDLRINHCDVNCECETLIFYKLFSDKQKQEFIDWLNKQNYTNYAYSNENIKGELIKKFMDNKNYKL